MSNGKRPVCCQEKMKRLYTTDVDGVKRGYGWVCKICGTTRKDAAEE